MQKIIYRIKKKKTARIDFHLTFLTTFAEKLNDYTMLNTVDEGIEAVRQGKIVIVVDDENRENEGDFIVSGEK